MSQTALYLSLLLQCLTGLAIIGAAFTAWQGTNMNKVASAKADLPAEKKNPGNPWLIAATLLTIAALVLGALGFGSTAYGAFKSAPAVTETATPPTPEPGATEAPATNEPAPVFNNMMPGPVAVTQPMQKTIAYVWIDITWLDEEHTGALVWVNYSTALNEPRIVGQYDNNPLHERRAWTSLDGKAWEGIFTGTCYMAEDIMNGALGTTNVTVYYTDGNGSYFTQNKIPSCSQVPNYKP
jgi:hypothetical protein